MPQVDFIQDVDGFAFPNEWTFDEREKDEIASILKDALPIAAAALTPIVMAASPMIAPVAGIVLGPVIPLVAAAGPFLFLAAPKISEMIVDAVVGQIAKGNGNDNLCGGMTAAALDYHRQGWLPPRGEANPVYDPNDPTSVQSWLRQRMWNGQLESHLDNTPRVVMWKAIASVFGDWGHDWLRDRTREELAKIWTELSAGNAVPVGLVWNYGDAVGHIVVGYALERYGADQYALTVYDNEHPDAPRIFDIDLAQSPAMIMDRQGRGCDGLFLAQVRAKLPPPAIVLSQPLAITPDNYLVEGESLQAVFGMCNSGFGPAPDVAGAIVSTNGQIVAPPAARQLPMVSDPATPPGTPPDEVETIPQLSPLAVDDEYAVSLQSTTVTAGAYQLEPIVMAGSVLLGRRVVRKLPNPDGSHAVTAPLRINPRLRIRPRREATGFGCARMMVGGESLTLDVDLASVSSRGVHLIVWSVTGAFSMTALGPTLVIPALPMYPAKCDVMVKVELMDGTETYGTTNVFGVTAAMAERVKRICELAHVIQRVPLTRVPLDPLINPVRSRDLISHGKGMPEAGRIAAELQKALEPFARMPPQR